MVHIAQSNNVRKQNPSESKPFQWDIGNYGNFRRTNVKSQTDCVNSQDTTLKFVVFFLLIKNPLNVKRI